MRRPIAVLALLVAELSLTSVSASAATATIHRGGDEFLVAAGDRPVMDALFNPPYPAEMTTVDDVTMWSYLAEARYETTAHFNQNLIWGDHWYCSGDCSGSFRITFQSTSLSRPPLVPNFGVYGVNVFLAEELDLENLFVATVHFGNGDVIEYALPVSGHWGITSPEMVTKIHFGDRAGHRNLQGIWSWAAYSSAAGSSLTASTAAAHGGGGQS